jgi:hypothetical protein
MSHVQNAPPMSAPRIARTSHYRIPVVADKKLAAIAAVSAQGLANGAPASFTVSTPRFPALPL